MDSPLDISKCTVAQLKDRLSSRGLSILGKKAELIGRLKDAEEGDEEDEEEVADVEAEEIMKNISDIGGDDEIDQPVDQFSESADIAAQSTEKDDQEVNEENDGSVDDVEQTDETQTDDNADTADKKDGDEVNESLDHSVEIGAESTDVTENTEKEDSAMEDQETSEESQGPSQIVIEIDETGTFNQNEEEAQPDMRQMVLLDDLDDRDPEAMETETEKGEQKEEENKTPGKEQEKSEEDTKSKKPDVSEMKMSSPSPSKSTTPKGPTIQGFKPKKEVPEDKIVRQDLRKTRIQNTLAMYPLQMSDLSHPTMISCLEKCFNFNTRFDSPLANQQSKKWEGYLEICFTRHAIMEQCMEQLKTMRQGLNVTALCDKKQGEILRQWHKQKGSTSDLVQDLLLYIEDLSPKTNEDELRNILPKACEILVPKLPNGDICGHGYATFATTESLTEAVDSLAGKVLNGVVLQGATYNYAYAYHLINTVGWPPKKGGDIHSLNARIRVLEKLLVSTPKPTAGVLRKAEKLKEFFDEQLKERLAGPKKTKWKRGQPALGIKASPIDQSPGNKALPKFKKRQGPNNQQLQRQGQNQQQRPSMTQLRKRQEERKARHRQLLDVRKGVQQRSNARGGVRIDNNNGPGPQHGGNGPRQRYGRPGGPGSRPPVRVDSRGPGGPSNRRDLPLSSGPGPRGSGSRRDSRERGGKSGQEGLLPMLQQQGLLPKATSHEQLLAQQLLTQQQQLMQLQQAQLEVQPLLKQMSGDLSVNQYRGRDIDHRQIDDSYQDGRRNDERKRKRGNSMSDNPVDNKRSLMGSPPAGGSRDHYDGPRRYGTGSGSQERSNYSRTDGYADYKRSDQSRYTSDMSAALGSSANVSYRNLGSEYSPQYATSSNYTGGYGGGASSAAVGANSGQSSRGGRGSYGYGGSSRSDMQSPRGNKHPGDSGGGRYSDSMQGSSGLRKTRGKKKNRYSGGGGGRGGGGGNGGGSGRSDHNSGDGLDRENAQNLLMTLNQLLTTQLTDGQGNNTGGYGNQRKQRGNRR